MHLTTIILYQTVNKNWIWITDPRRFFSIDKKTKHKTRNSYNWNTLQYFFFSTCYSSWKLIEILTFTWWLTKVAHLQNLDIFHGQIKIIKPIVNESLKIQNLKKKLKTKKYNFIL